MVEPQAAAVCLSAQCVLRVANRPLAYLQQMASGLRGFDAAGFAQCSQRYSAGTSGSDVSMLDNHGPNDLCFFRRKLQPY